MHTFNDLVTVFFTGVLFGILVTSISLMYVSHVLPKQLKRLTRRNKRRQMYDLRRDRPNLRRVK